MRFISGEPSDKGGSARRGLTRVYANFKASLRRLERNNGGVVSRPARPWRGRTKTVCLLQIEWNRA